MPEYDMLAQVEDVKGKEFNNSLKERINYYRKNKSNKGSVMNRYR